MALLRVYKKEIPFVMDIAQLMENLSQTGL